LGALVFGTLGSATGIGSALQLGGLALIVATVIVFASSPALRAHGRALVTAGGLIVPSDR
jgi:hypothetical protein